MFASLLARYHSIPEPQAEIKRSQKDSASIGNKKHTSCIGGKENIGVK